MTETVTLKELLVQMVAAEADLRRCEDAVLRQMIDDDRVVADRRFGNANRFREQIEHERAEFVQRTELSSIVTAGRVQSEASMARMDERLSNVEHNFVNVSEFRTWRDDALKRREQWSQDLALLLPREVFDRIVGALEATDAKLLNEIAEMRGAATRSENLTRLLLTVLGILIAGVALWLRSGPR